MFHKCLLIYINKKPIFIICCKKKGNRDYVIYTFIMLISTKVAWIMLYYYC